MSVNFGGGLPPAPNDPNTVAGHPQPVPQQQGQAANAPVMNAQAAAVSPLQAASPSDTNEPNTEPALSPRDEFSAMLAKQRADWVKVKQAIRDGEIATVHRMLDQGLLPCLVQKDESGESCYLFASADVFRDLKDIELFDRFVGLFVRHGSQDKLFSLVMKAENGILLKRLVQAGVTGWKQVPDVLPDLIAKALVKGDAAQVEAFIRLWKEHCPTCKIDWNKICENLTELPSRDVVRVLVCELRPDQLPDPSLAHWFGMAVSSDGLALEVTANEVPAVSILCEWLGDKLETFSQCRDWRCVENSLNEQGLLVMARGGFPLAAEVLPEPGHSLAKQLQLTLFGPKLAKGAFARMLSCTPCLPEQVTDFIYGCAFMGKEPVKEFERARLLYCDGIALKLFRHGLTPELSTRLATAMAAYLRPDLYYLFRAQQRLGFIACLNESLNPDAVEPLTDPLSIEQAQSIHTAVLEVVKSMMGDPETFFAAALACIRSDGTVDSEKLRCIYSKGKGLPAVMVTQIEATLKVLCTEVMSCALPHTLFKPGMTGVDFQKAFHDWIRQGVARLIITRLPRELGATVAQRDWNASPDSDDDELAAFDQSAPVNYLVTSVIRQYGQMLAENIDASSALIFDACLAVPADAFDHLGGTDGEDSSSVEQVSTAQSEAETDAESDSDTA